VQKTCTAENAVSTTVNLAVYSAGVYVHDGGVLVLSSDDAPQREAVDFEACEYSSHSAIVVCTLLAITAGVCIRNLDHVSAFTII
jgi:hypothetical protein